MCNNIPVRKIQNVAFFINGKVAQLALDSGCEGDCIREDECYRLNLEIVPLDNTDTNNPPGKVSGKPNTVISRKGKLLIYMSKHQKSFKTLST